MIPDPIKDALSQLTDEIKDLKDIVKHDICTNENSSDSVEEEYNDGAGI